jgi:hypothetical protein
MNYWYRQIPDMRIPAARHFSLQARQPCDIIPFELCFSPTVISAHIGNYQQKYMPNISGVFMVK